MAERILINLYIIGKNGKSSLCADRLRDILARNFPGGYELVVIDLAEQPEKAEEDKIMVAPTAVKILPPPMQKIVGSLENEEKVLQGLGLQTKVS
jgi:circadian clock protein KaiB